MSRLWNSWKSASATTVDILHAPAAVEWARINKTPPGPEIWYIEGRWLFEMKNANNLNSFKYVPGPALGLIDK